MDVEEALKKAREGTADISFYARQYQQLAVLMKKKAFEHMGDAFEYGVRATGGMKDEWTDLRERCEVMEGEYRKLAENFMTVARTLRTATQIEALPHIIVYHAVFEKLL